MTTKPDDLQKQLDEIQRLQRLEQQIGDYIKDETTDLQKQLAEKREAMAALQQEIDVLEAQVREAAAEGFEDLQNAQQDLKKGLDTLKTAVSKLDPDLLAKTYKLSSTDEQLQMTVSKTDAISAYPLSMLDDHPEIAGMVVEGDPVVVSTIDAVLIDRLVAEGKLPESLQKDYRVRGLAKTPRVSLKDLSSE